MLVWFVLNHAMPCHAITHHTIPYHTKLNQTTPHNTWHHTTPLTNNIIQTTYHTTKIRYLCSKSPHNVSWIGKNIACGTPHKIVQNKIFSTRKLPCYPLKQKNKPKYESGGEFSLGQNSICVVYMYVKKYPMVLDARLNCTCLSTLIWIFSLLRVFSPFCQ